MYEIQHGILSVPDCRIRVMILRSRFDKDQLPPLILLQAHARRLSQVLTREAEPNDGTQEDFMYPEAATALEESSPREGMTGREPRESSGILPEDSLRGQISPGDSLRGQQLREWYARQLLQPEWMIDVPPDLATHWCALFLSGRSVFPSTSVDSFGSYFPRSACVTRFGTVTLS